MLELRRGDAHVIRYLAPSEILDAVDAGPGVEACRVAPDELLLIGSPAELDFPEGLAVDESGGWAEWTLSGPYARGALARLSDLPHRFGFLQGAVAGVPAKAIVAEEEVRLLVAASVGHHVEERVHAACSDLLEL